MKKFRLNANVFVVYQTGNPFCGLYYGKLVERDQYCSGKIEYRVVFSEKKKPDYFPMIPKYIDKPAFLPTLESMIFIEDNFDSHDIDIDIDLFGTKTAHFYIFINMQEAKDYILKYQASYIKEVELLMKEMKSMKKDTLSI